MLSVTNSVVAPVTFHMHIGSGEFNDGNYKAINVLKYLQNEAEIKEEDKHAEKLRKALAYIRKLKERKTEQRINTFKDEIKALDKYNKESRKPAASAEYNRKMWKNM